MLSDLPFILNWWLTFLIVGLVFLPLTVLVFKSFWDKGYIFSKVIGSVLLSFTIFVLGFLHFVSFTRTNLYLLLAVFLFFNLYLIRRFGVNKFKKELKGKIKFFIIEEVVFTLILVVWSYVRGFNPDINGLEKYMDWGFVNSILRSRYFPPADMWFAGLPINYYYFGQLVVAVLTRLSSLDSAITYNLAIASTCALTFVSGFSFASNVIAKISAKIKLSYIIIGGLLSALLLTFGGNLHPLYKIAAIDVANNHGHLVLTSSEIQKAANSYWYPDATRFIGYDPDTHDKTIHEFPVYSFVVADLHGHMNGIPGNLLLLSLLFVVYPFTRKKFLNPQLFIPLGFLLSVSYMTNAWDIAVYGMFFGISFFIYHFYDSKSFITAATKTIVNGLLAIVCWYIFTLPFSIFFTPMVEGLRLSDAHSPFYQLFILYGGFWLISLPLVAFVITKLIKKTALTQSDLFVFALVITATILIIIPEIGYIKDIYISDYRRANTMFKLVYQAFIMYTLVGGYCLIRLRRSVAYKILFALIFTVQMIYPFFAIKSYYGFTAYQGLYGQTYLKNLYPDNYAGIGWLNQNVTGQPHIVEAAGDSYTTFDQVSVATGLPTIEGWIVHEWLWRGGYDKPAARQSDVEKIYESSDLNSVKALLKQYDVKYIFVGAKEYEKYPDLDPARFAKIGAKLVFTSGKTEIYQYN